MHIQKTSGSAAAGLGIIGTGLSVALPENKWIGWLLIAVGLLVFLFDIRIEGWHIRAGRLRETRLNIWGPWVLIIGAPLLGMLWLYLRPIMPNPEAKGPAQSRIEASVPKLFMECAPANLPTVWPSGPLYVLQLNPIPAPYGNGLGEYGVNSGSPVNFGFQGIVYRCQITNYSEAPIFNSAISLHLTFREAIQKVSQYESGPITIDREWLIQMGKIDSGRDNPYTFFVFNASTQFVEVALPKTISIQRDDGMDIINLITGPNVTMHFSPRVSAPSAGKSPTNHK